jgi:hypothetical protein
MNNTPFNWKNQTEFVPFTPSTPREKTMSTFDYLNNAETQLRNALKSTSDLSQAYQLRRIVDTINTVGEIKNQFKFSVTEENKVNDGFFQRENYEELYGGYNLGATFPIPSASSPDNLILG